MKKLNKITVILLAVILTCIIAISASFSWLTRPNGQTDPANKVQLSGVSAVVKSENCDVKTYACNLVDGKLDAGSLAADNGVTIAAGETKYFRTEIKNSSASKNNVSLVNLLISNATTSTTINNLSPLKTSKVYADNMSVAEHLTVSASSTLNVEWFISNGGSSDITISKLPQISYYS